VSSPALTWPFERPCVRETQDRLQDFLDDIPTQVSRPIDLAATSFSGSTFAGRYRLHERVGQGGFGLVYRGEHLKLKKQVAIKLLKPQLLRGRESRERRLEFLEEAQAVARFAHDNIVDVTDFGDLGDSGVFMTLEWLDGENLARTLERDGPLPWSRARHIVLQVCAALQAAHAEGVLHRDIKPENCFRLSRGGDPDHIKVLDFGLAEFLYRSRAPTRFHGTPEYMSPEQIAGAELDVRSEVYSLGILLFELLTGTVPFHDDGPGELERVLAMHRDCEPPAPSSLLPTGGIPPEVDAIVLRALDKRPGRRFPSVLALATALRSVGSGAGVISQPMGAAISGEVVIAEQARELDKYRLLLGGAAGLSAGLALLLLLLVVSLVL
jgi:serine/threonine-protein kinase